MLKVVGLGLMIAGIIASAYGVYGVMTYRPLPPDWKPQPADVLAAVLQERDRRMINDIRATSRGEAERVLWSGIAGIVVGAICLWPPRLGKKPEPPSLFH